MGQRCQRWAHWSVWEPWLIGLSLLLAGAAIGALGLARFVAPILGEPTAELRSGVSSALFAHGREEAMVLSSLGALRADDGGGWLMTWLVVNRGEAPWEIDLYRFVPETPEDPVLHLPRTIRPGSEALVRAHLADSVWEDDPARRGLQTSRIWYLTGPRGRVDGGILRLTTESS